jgi:hypothetical protein
VAAIVMNGDLGRDFPLGRGLELSSDSFRVVALRYRGLSGTVEQAAACRSGAVLEHPDRYGAVVQTVRSLTVLPADARREFMVNVDGLKMKARREVNVSVDGTVSLVAGRLDA